MKFPTQLKLYKEAGTLVVIKVKAAKHDNIANIYRT